jgi:hypothetical protein
MDQVSLQNRSLKWLSARANFYEKKLKKLEDIMMLPRSGHAPRKALVPIHRQPKNIAKTYRVEIARILAAIESFND